MLLVGLASGRNANGVSFMFNLGSYATDCLITQDNKTALYWAVEKGNATMVRDILQCNPDTEICTKVHVTSLSCKCQRHAESPHCL